MPSIFGIPRYQQKGQSEGVGCGWLGCVGVGVGMGVGCGCGCGVGVYGGIQLAPCPASRTPAAHLSY